MTICDSRSRSTAASLLERRLLTMRFKGNLASMRLDIPAYRERLHKRLFEAIQQAAKEWLHATVLEIPVWSGASAATFLKLAQATAFSLGISPRAGVPNRISLGLSQSEGAIVADKARGDYHLEYATSLAHLIWNEFHNANVDPDPTLFAKLLKPGPYHFQEKGQEAFRRVAEHVRLPNPFDTVKITRRRIR